MTTITGGPDANGNVFDSSQLLALAAGTLGAHSSTQFVLTADPYTITGYGTGFSYSGNHPVSGTLTSLTITQTSFVGFATWSDFSLSAATVWGAIASGNTTSFNNLFFGGADTFNMQASTSVDFLAGYGGDDTFNYLGNFNSATHIDGGSGTDTLNLNGDYSGNGADFGYVTNVEFFNVAAGHSYQLGFVNSTPVTVDGSALGASNFLNVGAGSATGSLNVTGGAGNDTFASGAGDDTFNGGAGSDTVNYFQATGAVTVNLSISGPQAVGGGRGTDTLISVENIVGSSYNDTLTGNANDNFFSVTPGDSVNGGDGYDTVSFAAGPVGPFTIDLRSVSYVSIEKIIGSLFGGDIFIGDANDNFFDGNVRYYANPGPTLYDTVDYEYATGGMTITSIGGADTTYVATGGGQGTDTLVRINKIIGSNYDDTFGFDNGYPLLLDGGGGYDTVNFQNSLTPVQLPGGWTSIEHVIGSNYGDLLTFGNGSYLVDGGAGNDTIAKGINGSAVNGNDTFIGGAGNDTVFYDQPVGNYTITYNPDHSITVYSATEGTDTLWGIEKMVFANTPITVGSYLVRRDFDANGQNDILWQNDNGQAAVWLMNGSAPSGAAIGGNPGTSWHATGTGDFDADGKADVLWQNADGSVAIWFMHGAQVYAGGLTSLNPGPSWQVVSSGDFNSDGFADILFRNTDGTPAIWLMNQTNIISGVALPNPGTSWRLIGTGDFDGDDKSDILWQNVDGTPAIWLMNGTSIVSGAALPNPGTSWQLKGSGDFNGDGKSDLLWQNVDGTAAVWLMNGTSYVAGGIAGPNLGTSWHLIGAEDINGDGKADILWQNVDGTPVIWLMNGTSLSSTLAFANPGSNWHIISATS